MFTSNLVYSPFKEHIEYSEIILIMKLPSARNMRILKWNSLRGLVAVAVITLVLVSVFSYF